MEFRNQEDEIIGGLPQYGRSAAFSRPPSRSGGDRDIDVGASSPPLDAAVRYHECLRNHAAALGGHVVDGCGEFMPAMEGDPLRCAACGCHRSFHRKETTGDGRSDNAHAIAAASSRRPSCSGTPPQMLLPPPHPYSSFHHRIPTAPSPPFFASGATSGSGGTTTESSSEERQHHSRRGKHPMDDGGGGMPRKRHRTKFTAEQKSQMLAFAERVGWRLPRSGEADVEQFCSQVGVRRNVLKVWMHNNKHCSSGGGDSGNGKQQKQLLLPQLQQQQSHHHHHHQ